jgi:ribosomal protein S18 acetylase RimI-like enzyme
MSSSAVSSGTRNNVDLSLRWLAVADISQIRELLLANRPVFSDEECTTAIEMIEEQLAGKHTEDPYQFLVAEVGGRVLAYACFGTIALTQGAFDLYWIAVHPDAHGTGIGRTLLLRCEQEMAAQGGRLVVVETSSRSVYDKTRRFYEKTMGYETAMRIRDFYKPGDDKVVYVKYLAPAERP